MAVEQLPLKRAATETLPKRSTSRWIALGGVAATVGLAAIDQGIPRINHRRAEAAASVVTHQNDGEKAIFILPGCRADGQAIANTLEPRFSELGDTAYTVYPKVGFNLESIKDTLLEARQKNLDKPASFYAISMGGLVLSHLLDDGDFRRNFGEIDTIVLDSSPSGWDDLRPATKKALLAARVFGDSWMIHRTAQNRIRQHALSSKFLGTDTPPGTFEKLKGAAAKTFMPTTVEQGRFMRSADARAMLLADTAKSVYYVHALEDKVIDTVRAYPVYGEAYGGITEVFDPKRPIDSHALGTIYQQKIVDLLAGEMREY